MSKMGLKGRKYFQNPFIALLLAISTGAFASEAIERIFIADMESPKRLCGSYDERFYFNETRKCHNRLYWSKGNPCGEFMYPEITDDILGLGKCLCKPSGCAGRPVAYWPEKNRCYYIFDQGPCTEGQWIVPSTDGVGKCENIPCLDRYNRQDKPNMEEVDVGFYDVTSKLSYLFPIENNCYMTYAENDGACPEGEYAVFDTPTPTHNCSKPFQCPRIFEWFDNVGLPPINHCSEGEEPDIHGDCQSQTEFA